MLKRRNKLVNRTTVSKTGVYADNTQRPSVAVETGHEKRRPAKAVPTSKAVPASGGQNSGLNLNSARIRRNARVSTSTKPKTDSTNKRTGLRLNRRSGLGGVNTGHSRINKQNTVRPPKDVHRVSTRKETSLPKKRTASRGVSPLHIGRSPILSRDRRSLQHGLRPSLRSVDREARNSRGQKLVIRYTKPYGLTKPLNAVRKMTTKAVGGVINKIKTDFGRHYKVIDVSKTNTQKVNKNKTVKDEVRVEDIIETDACVSTGPTHLENPESVTETVKDSLQQTLSNKESISDSVREPSIKTVSNHIVVKHVFIHKLRCLNGTYELNDFIEAVRSFNNESKELYDEGDKEVTFIYVMDDNEKEIDLTKQNPNYGHVGDMVKLYCKESDKLYTIGLVEFV